MKVSRLPHFKTFVNDELKQPKHWKRRIKRLTMYKDNKPVTWGELKKQK